MNHTIDQLQRAFEQLPDSLQDYIMSDEVSDALETLISWFEIEKPEDFRQAVMAMVTGLADADEFTAFAEHELGLNTEDAGVLFGEVGDRVLVKLQDLFDESEKMAGNVPRQSTTPVVQPQMPRPLVGDMRKFVGVPNYGVERPASSYTSVLPRSQVELNKMKDTPTADSFITRLNAMGNPIGNAAMPAVASPTPVAPSPAPVLVPTKTAPPPENLPVLTKDEPPTELAKLARPVNIPRKEITIAPPQSPPKNQPKPYPQGTDPYRESPAP